MADGRFAAVESPVTLSPVFHFAAAKKAEFGLYKAACFRTGRLIQILDFQSSKLGIKSLPGAKSPEGFRYSLWPTGVKAW